MSRLVKGALALALEQLKAKFTAEGLFCQSNKKLLPQFSETIVLVTSPQGIALRDMLQVLREQMLSILVILSNCRVQGDVSAMEIAAAVKKLDVSNLFNIIIVGHIKLRCLRNSA